MIARTDRKWITVLMPFAVLVGCTSALTEAERVDHSALPVPVTAAGLHPEPVRGQSREPAAAPARDNHAAEPVPSLDEVLSGLSSQVGGPIPDGEEEIAEVDVPAEGPGETVVAAATAIEESTVELPSAGDGDDTPLDTAVFHFETNEARLSEEDLAILKAHAEYLLHHSSLMLVIQGHADSRGAETYNMALSRARAEAVARALRQFGVPAQQLDLYAFGEQVPVSHFDHYDENRRVEIQYWDNYALNAEAP